MISNFDRAHTFVSSGLVELPFGRDRRFGSRLVARDGRVPRRLAGRLHLQGAERRAARVRQLPVRRGDGRRRHHGRQSQRGSVVQRQRVQSRHGAAARLERAHAAEPVRGSARTRATRCSICRCSRTSASAAPASSSSGSSRTTRLNRANLQNPNTTVTSTALGTSRRRTVCRGSCKLPPSSRSDSGFGARGSGLANLAIRDPEPRALSELPPDGPVRRGRTAV